MTPTILPNLKRMRSVADWPLALRLTALYTLSGGITLALLTASLYLALARSVRNEQDHFLVSKLHSVRMLLRDGSDVNSLRAEAEEDWVSQQYIPVYLRVLSADGSVAIAESPTMDRQIPPAAFAAPVAGNVVAPSAGALKGASRNHLRGFAARAASGRGPEVTVQLAIDTTPQARLLRRYRRTLWLTCAIGLVACAASGYYVAWRALAPLRRISASVARVRPSTLNQRIEDDHLPPELRRLARAFNVVLGRLDDSFARLRRFAADLAHELRTPVHVLHSALEVGLQRERSDGEYKALLGTLLEESSSLSRLIESLLFIARADDPRTEVHREMIDVTRELQRLGELYETVADEAKLRVRVQCPPGITASVDGSLFRRAIDNLVTNAIAYTPPGGCVDLTADLQGDNLRIVVSDNGRGIPAADLPHVFDRFYRADTARSRRAGNLGLGLSIVKVIVAMHGGTVDIQSVVGKGTRVELVFPAASDESLKMADARA
jgi:two-component system heavy metal sensor histidine kinase CusS